jgi:hypothetical protein
MSAALKKAVGAFGAAGTAVMKAGSISTEFVKALGSDALTKAKESFAKFDARFASNAVTKSINAKAPRTPKGIKGSEELANEMAKQAKNAANDVNNIPKRAVEDAANIGKNMPDTKGGKWTAALKLMTTVVVMIGAATIAGLVIKAYKDKAEEEKEVCLADWTATYIDVLTRPDGTLYKIDTPEEWTASILEIQSYINALESVKNDEAKATKFLLTMNEGLMNCLAIDTEPISATLSGLAKSAGDAVKKVLTGVTDPLNDTVDSLSENVKIILIAVGAVIGAIILLLIVYYFTSTKPGVVDMRNRHKELMLSQYNRAIALPRRLRDGVANRSRRQQYRRLLE